MLAVLGAVGAVGGIFMMIEPIKGAIGWIRKKLNSGERVKYEEAAEIINKKYKAKADLVDEQIDNVTMSRTLPPEVKTALIRNLKAQKSWQASFGLDYNFKMLERPARFTTEIYYKNMWDVVPYDVDNVRVRYFGENSAKAYAVGIETRLYGEFVKDAESWISFG